MSMGSRTVLVLLGIALLWTPPADSAQGVAPSTHAASCRDSRLPPRSKTPVEEGAHLRFEVDVNGDGFVDLLEVTDSLGSGFKSTEVRLTLRGSETQLAAREEFAFTTITAINPVL